MFQDWVTPLNDVMIQAALNGRDNIAAQINTNTQPEMSGPSIALIGADSKWANRVRRQLYLFAGCCNNSTLYDLGDLKRLDDATLGQLAIELLEASILPVFLGLRNDMTRGLNHYLRDAMPDLHGMYLQESFPYWVSNVAEEEAMGFLGLQSHLLTNDQLTTVERTNIMWKRLSQVRESLDECEPEIRDCGFFNFDLSAMRSADMPAQISYSSSGLTTEEACRLMRYAGLSPELKCLSISGHDPLSVEYGLSSNTTAQLIWYFMSGFDKRVIERPNSSDRFTQYLVHLQRFDFDLTFYKSNMSGRWWLQLPAASGMRLFSCAYGDYLAACEDVVTDRVVKCVESSMDVAHH